ncbi:MAG: 50S ribosomal protein L28 [bacterium]
MIFFTSDFENLEVNKLARRCYVCGKGPVTGNTISNAENKTKRKWLPNLQRIRIQLEDGAIKRVRVCTKCIKSGKIKKPLVTS